MPLFFIFLAIPILEIIAFIVIGGQIGIAATLAMILLTAIAGTALLRHQGLAMIGRIRADLAGQRVPAKPLVEGAMIAAAGLLLLTPGFITDGIGFLLFVPPVRAVLWRTIAARFYVTAGRTMASESMAGGSKGNPSPGGRARKRPAATIDLEEGEYSARPDPDSPWREPDEQ
ncbi:MAG: FxsA family protein [Alphaproteobacteria bacterium]